MNRLIKAIQAGKFATQAWVKLKKMLVSDYGRMWSGSYMVDIPLQGQGNRRTRMAEAACKALRNSGYEAYMYYQCD